MRDSRLGDPRGFATIAQTARQEHKQHIAISSTPTQATQILDRVIPRLQHNNGAVVLGAIKLVLTQVEHVPKAEQAKYLAKLTPPLVTMVRARGPHYKLPLRCHPIPCMLAAACKSVC